MTAGIAEGAWVLNLDTPTLPPATATNTLIVGGDRLLIIEPATPHAREQARLDALIASLLADGRALAGIVVTHHHVDHIGYAPALRDRHEIPIFAHPQTASRLDFPIDTHIDEGWTIDLGEGHVVEALFTPGHAPGHLVVWDRKTNIAHAGDLVAGEGTILVDVSDGGDMGVYLDSLRRMAAHVRAHQADGQSPSFVPAHGPVLDDPVAVLEHYVSHRLAREAKIRRAVVEGGRRAFLGILAAAYDDVPKKLWPIAAMSVEAHLRKLVADGELVRVGKGARPAAG
ncbi:Metallo-beta-lactamase family protein [Enhygromyxa salina]|uniref:Metallo-beta-lactamase family protein n=1 Tax=Enhygromyxa salina TaxID=215803 RepID=A0A0C1ZUL2_9BACT|nr:MBL fold metallo-hydrolase [Enhygromyxa salina]KIG14718.1 Metallo-beta-lactamase family protein [Enhygromyxa salina]